ncbi:hypothetical protein H103_04588, partial [Trichophyton rubrum CBS 288.86]
VVDTRLEAELLFSSLLSHAGSQPLKLPQQSRTSVTSPPSPIVFYIYSPVVVGNQSNNTPSSHRRPESSVNITRSPVAKTNLPVVFTCNPQTAERRRAVEQAVIERG